MTEITTTDVPTVEEVHLVPEDSQVVPVDELHSEVKRGERGELTTKDGTIIMPPLEAPVEEHIPFDKLPSREKTEEETQFIKSHLDDTKKIKFVNNLIKFSEGGAMRFRFDASLMKKCRDDIRFCYAIKGALMFDSPDQVKHHMLQYIYNDFDGTVKEVVIMRKGDVNEKDTCIVMNPRDDSQIAWIKFLREKITDQVWKEHKESQAGMDTVVIS